MLSLFIPTSRELVGSRTIDYNSMLNRTVKEVRSEVLSLFIPVYPDKSGTCRELVGSRTFWETFVEMKNHLHLDVYVSYFEHPTLPIDYPFFQYPFSINRTRIPLEQLPRRFLNHTITLSEHYRNIIVTLP